MWLLLRPRFTRCVVRGPRRSSGSLACVFRGGGGVALARYWLARFWRLLAWSAILITGFTRVCAGWGGAGRGRARRGMAWRGGGDDGGDDDGGGGDGDGDGIGSELVFSLV